MSTEQALLNAIRAEPHDDVPRLVYADWLEERGDDKHRFVRGHVELRRVVPDDPRRATAEAELSLLRKDLSADWLRVVEPERSHLFGPPGPDVRVPCDCFEPIYDPARKWHKLSLHHEAQDTECDAWKRLCDLVDQAEKDGRERFAPLTDMPFDQRRFIVTLPPTVRRLKAVKVLNLYGSSLVRIPAEIGEMDGLEEFDPYTSYRLHWYPHEITHCQNLKRSRMSTRALYGNRKYHPPFAELPPVEQPAAFALTCLTRPAVRPCSVCRRPFENRQEHRVWITLRVATDDMPLLVNACSRECVRGLPSPKQGFCQYPHRGGVGTPRRYRT
jgi:uncharacterized protein (TIGR02996 family)